MDGHYDFMCLSYGLIWCRQSVFRFYRTGSDGQDIKTKFMAFIERLPVSEWETVATKRAKEDISSNLGVT